MHLMEFRGTLKLFRKNKFYLCLAAEEALFSKFQ